MELPEDIIHNVLSFLGDKVDGRETARTMLLSKAWLSAWRTRPRLQFHRYDFKHKDDFVNHANATLLMFQEKKIRIQELELDVSFSYDMELVLNRWLQIAEERGVKKLKLISNLVPRDWLSIILQAKSLEDLLLHGRGKSTSHLQKTQTIKISCSKLKRLSITNVYLDEGIFHNIISSCHSIEFLKLHRCNMSFKNFEVANLENFRELIIDGCHDLRRIKISSRALENLELRCWDPERELIELEIEAPSIVRFEYYGSIIPHLSFTCGSGHRFPVIKIILNTLVVDDSWLRELLEFLNQFVPSNIDLYLIDLWETDLSDKEIRAELALLKPHLRMVKIKDRTSMEGCRIIF